MPKIESGTVRMHTSGLCVGMCISRLETIAGESSLFEQFDIKTQTDIQAIQGACSYVFIDVKQYEKYYGLSERGSFH